MNQLRTEVVIMSSDIKKGSIRNMVDVHSTAVAALQVRLTAIEGKLE